MNAPVNNQTRLFLSVAAQPGNFGATVFNALFAHYGVNAVYIPRKAPGAAGLARALRVLEVAGCSVSMPLKTAIIPHLDELSAEAAEIGSVNTILNTSGVLKGYNTDYSGCLEVLRQRSVNSVLIYGSGSVVNSVVRAAQAAGVSEIRLVARNPARARAKARSLGLSVPVKEEAGAAPVKRFDLLINATPSGDAPEDAVRGWLPRCGGLFDLRVRAEASPLETAARGLGLWTVPGVEMAKFQLRRQFEIYAGVLPPVELLDSVIAGSFLRKGAQPPVQRAP